MAKVAAEGVETVPTGGRGTSEVGTAAKRNGRGDGSDSVARGAFEGGLYLAGPRVHAGHRRDREGRVGRKALDFFTKTLESSLEPATNRSHWDFEHRGELRSPECLEVVELENDLMIEREVSQRPKEQRMFLLAHDNGARAWVEVDDARASNLVTGPELLPGSIFGEQNVARASQKVGAKPCVALDPRSALDACDEGPLDEVVDRPLILLRKKRNTELKWRSNSSLPASASPFLHRSSWSISSSDAVPEARIETPATDLQGG